MSYDPIVEGSEATPGLWNRRFASVWDSLETLSGSSGTAILFSGVTGVRGASGWAIESGLSLVRAQVNGDLILPSSQIFYQGGGTALTDAFFQNAIQVSGNTANSWRVGWQGPSDGQVQYGFNVQSVNSSSVFSGDGAWYLGGVQTVAHRQTGWTSVPTGTPIRTTFVTSTATLGDVAQRLAALIIDLTTHGLIGP